ncbi:MAG: sigma 54-interacting transcriptional regulator [Chitinivibrionales bacterium]|nr:sigma 54-interacting transcriptional regulator [Chitinivibrionales bacterium]
MNFPTLSESLHFNGLSALYRIARILGTGGSLPDIMASVLEILDVEAGMQRGMISILNADNSQLMADVTHGIPDSAKVRGKYRLGEGITGKVVATGKAIIVPDIRNEPAFLNKTGARKNLKEKQRSFLCVPIKAGSHVVGALSADSVAASEADKLTPQLHFLEAVSDLIAQLVQQRRKQTERIAALEEENLQLRKTLEEQGKPAEMIGNSSSMREVYRQIGQVALSPTSVLVLGETGTGKELVARAIHQKSACADGPFIAVNCAALPESLLESELFGHEKGSFTGAFNKRIGKFEAAGGGTLFLDEVGEMPPSAQSRLLRAIAEKEFTRVGGDEVIRADVRLITATNRNLQEDVGEGRFREDLFYRINVFTIAIPPLRQRGADVLLLADYFVKKYTDLHQKKIARISTPAIDMLSAYHWPGNVRELENVMERAVLVAANHTIEGHDLPPTLQIKGVAQQQNRKGTFEAMVSAYEKELIVDALKDTRGNQTAAAELLGTTKRVVQYKIENYQIDYKRFKKS